MPSNSMSEKKPKNSPARVQPAVQMEEIPEDLRAVLSDLPAPKKQQVMRVMMAAVHRSGPLPPPGDFAQYGETLPDAPNRILGMAERQADHRMALEKLVIGSQLRQSRVGQLLAAGLGIVCIAASTFLSLNGHEAVAGVLGGTTVLGLVATFIVGRNSQKEDLEKKKPA